MRHTVTYPTYEELAKLLADALDLCARARKLDEAALEDWKRPPGMSSSLTPHLWVSEQYDRDLADWEQASRVALDRVADLDFQ